MARLAGKVAIVTDGDGGIGSESARLFAPDRARVVVADINREAVQRSAQSAIDLALALTCEISDEESVKQLVTTPVDKLGGLDLLFANAADTDIMEDDTNDGARQSGHRWRATQYHNET
jgi:3-oxoacyl-[acyl-carrier protein] reductase